MEVMLESCLRMTRKMMRMLSSIRQTLTAVIRLLSLCKKTVRLSGDTFTSQAPGLVIKRPEQKFFQQ